MSVLLSKLLVGIYTLSYNDILMLAILASSSNILCTIFEFSTSD